MRKLPVVPICRNPTALPLPPNQRQISRRPVLTKRGASRSSRTLGAGCGGRDGDARRAAPARTAKSCGPDAPTLASSFRGVIPAQATVAKEPGHRGEHEVTVKTIAQGRPDVSGESVVTILVCFFISHARLRVQRAPGFPCALVFSWANGFQNSGAQRRGKVDLCLLSNRCLWLTRGLGGMTVGVA
jgi:hypothetical protein